MKLLESIIRLGPEATEEKQDIGESKEAGCFCHCCFVLSVWFLNTQTTSRKFTKSTFLFSEMCQIKRKQIETETNATIL